MKSIADEIRKAFPHKQEALQEIIRFAELKDDHSKLIEMLKDDLNIITDELRSIEGNSDEFRKRVFVRTYSLL